MALQPFERETVIGYSNQDSTATITTFNRAMLNKLEKYCKQYPKDYKLIREIIIDNEVAGKEYSFPKKLVTIRIPSNKKLTDEQKKAAGERLKNTHKKNKNTKINL